MPFVCGLAEVCGPALTITLEWSEIASDLDLFVTEPDGSIVSFARMVGVSAHSNGASLRHVQLFMGNYRLSDSLGAGVFQGWNHQVGD